MLMRASIRAGVEGQVTVFPILPLAQERHPSMGKQLRAQPWSVGPGRASGNAGNGLPTGGCSRLRGGSEGSTRPALRQAEPGPRSGSSGSEHSSP
jgi:hypothetical protein